MAFIATGADDKMVRIFDANTFEEVKQLSGHQRKVTDVEWSPDGLHLLSCSSPTVRVWDAKTGTEQLTITAHSEYVNSVAWSKKSGAFASCSQDKTVKMWNVAGELQTTLEGHTDAVTGIAFSPDGSKLASCGMDGTLKLWTTDPSEASLPRRHDPECVKTLQGHTGRVFCVVFSPDGTLLASCGDCYVRVWKADTLEEVVACGPHAGIVSWAAFDNTSTHVVSCSKDQTVRLWDLKTGSEVWCLDSKLTEVSRVAYSPCGKRLAACGPEGVPIIDTESGTITGMLKHPPGLSAIFGVTWSPEGFTDLEVAPPA